MADEERPAKQIPWSVWKSRYGHHRFFYLLTVEWGMEWVVYWLKGLALIELLGIATRVSIVVAVVFYFMEADDRTRERHYRAWELVNSARGSTGDGGRKSALEELNADHVSLAGAPLDDAWLQEIQLPKAELPFAHLKGALLKKANLRGANLSGADLQGAMLTDADLSGANLFGANLRGASIYTTNLTGADLREANLLEVIADDSLESARRRGARFENTTMPNGSVSTEGKQPSNPKPSAN